MPTRAFWACCTFIWRKYFEYSQQNSVSGWLELWDAVHICPFLRNLHLKHQACVATSLHYYAYCITLVKAEEQRLQQAVQSRVPHNYNPCLMMIDLQNNCLFFIIVARQIAIFSTKAKATVFNFFLDSSHNLFQWLHA